MQVIAKARFVRKAPRKVRLVCDLIRGKDVNLALNQLAFLKKEACTPVRKLVESAIANATNNFQLDKNNLYISLITVDGGPVLKRWMPRAHGRATEIRKKTSHITVVLTEKVPSKVKSTKAGKKEDVPVVDKKPKQETVINTSGKVEAKKPEEVDGEEEIVDPRMRGKHRHGQKQVKKQAGEGSRNFMKKVFNRKSGS